MTHIERGFAERKPDGGGVPSGYLVRFAFAWAGSTIAYQPLTTFILPIRAAELQGRPDPILLSALIATSGIVAGIAHLGWGRLGDRLVVQGRSRRGGLAAGLIGTCGSYVLMAAADDAMALLASVAVFQIMLNLLLSSLIATAADDVPPSDKGLLGGLLGIGAPAGAVASVVVTSLALSLAEALMFVAVAATILVLPFRSSRTPSQVGLAPASGDIPSDARGHELALLWTARLILQVASKTFFFFLVYYFAEGTTELLAGTIAQLVLLGAILALPVSIMAGRLSDRHGAHRKALVILATMMSAGLALMAVQTHWTQAVAGYLLFAIASTACLSLHSGLYMLTLTNRVGNGTGLGLLNLANTLPSVLVAALASAVVPSQGYDSLCWILAAAVALAAIILACSPPHRHPLPEASSR